jgi:hypothetical protein
MAPLFGVDGNFRAVESAESLLQQALNFLSTYKVLRLPEILDAMLLLFIHNHTA